VTVGVVDEEVPHFRSHITATLRTVEGDGKEVEVLRQWLKRQVPQTVVSLVIIDCVWLVASNIILRHQLSRFFCIILTRLRWGLVNLS
jgi:hypothetical protein